jgi:hypothetical protein
MPCLQLKRRRRRDGVAGEQKIAQDEVLRKYHAALNEAAKVSVETARKRAEEERARVLADATEATVASLVARKISGILVQEEREALDEEKATVEAARKRAEELLADTTEAAAKVTEEAAATKAEAEKKIATKAEALEEAKAAMEKALAVIA